MWRSKVQHLRFRPADGMLVRALADASLYEKRGELQLVVRMLKPAGDGSLQKAFEDLKRKLHAEGLFNRQFKKAIPPFPSVIGIVTSDSGAALHDILSIIQRRFPCTSVVVCGVHVQGIRAAEAIAKAISLFNAQPAGSPRRPDVMIVGRGGGSLEDLWAFNEEVVARAIFQSVIPVISAVGHETDFSIADFVADVRAATPSMAAELAVPDGQKLGQTVKASVRKMGSDLRRRIERDRQRIRYLVASHGLQRPADHLRQLALRVDDLNERLHRFAARCVELKRRRWQSFHDRLELLNPERPLERGFALIERGGDLVKSVTQVRNGDHIGIRFYDGRRRAIIADSVADGSEGKGARTP
jgi:exodeoxyribonuclease VII large subunit